MTQANLSAANAEKHHKVHRSELPLSCPAPSMALWNSHPRVYISIENQADKKALCPYCGTTYELVD